MTTTDTRVRWQVEGRLGHLTLTRPEGGNAIDTRTARELADAIGEAARADVGAVLLSSTGDLFCAGGDIREFVERRHEIDTMISGILEILNPAILTLASLPVPVVSAVQGPIGGAGIAMALCADIVLASTSMKLRGGYSALGLTPDLGAAYYLARRAGPGRAKYLLMTNRPIDAEACLRFGLVDEVHPPEALRDAALALTTSLAHGSTGALGRIKRLVDDAHGIDLAEHLERERRAMLECTRSDDVREGVVAFMEKRAPRFGGRAG